MGDDGRSQGRGTAAAAAPESQGKTPHKRERAGQVAVTDDELLTTREAAAYLKMNEQTVRLYAREQRIPAVCVGRRWLIRHSALDAWIDSHQPPQRGATVLVVDDDRFVLDSVSQILEEEGFSVQTARDGAQALAVMHRNVPDLVLLDLKMPGIDGPSAFKEIRTTWDDLPVIILTGYPDSDLMFEALRYGPVTVLSKPADPDKLVAAVQQALRTRRPGG